jgi:hypothetical protein
VLLIIRSWFYWLRSTSLPSPFPPTPYLWAVFCTQKWNSPVPRSAPGTTNFLPPRSPSPLKVQAGVPLVTSQCSSCNQYSETGIGPWDLRRSFPPACLALFFPTTLQMALCHSQHLIPTPASLLPMQTHTIPGEWSRTGPEGPRDSSRMTWPGSSQPHPV